ncbi:MAG: hypothetical protein R2788_08060 [Saprospiraceae bacterium]
MNGSQTLDMEHDLEGLLAAEIVVTAEAEDQNVKNIEMSVEKLSAVRSNRFPK